MLKIDRSDQPRPPLIYFLTVSAKMLDTRLVLCLYIMYLQVHNLLRQVPVCNANKTSVVETSANERISIELWVRIEETS